MTRWGVILLLLYLGLGLSKTRVGKAATLGACVTTLVLMTVLAKTVR